MDSFILLAYASLAVQNHFATIANLPELYFIIRRFILFVETKKVISVNYGSSTSSWKPCRWVRLDLIRTMRDIYINSNLNPLTKFMKSSRSTDFKNIVSRNISQMITKTFSTSIKIVVSCAMKRGIPFWIWRKVNEKWDRNKSKKNRAVRVAVRDPSRKVNHPSKIIWDRKIIT